MGKGIENSYTQKQITNTHEKILNITDEEIKEDKNIDTILPKIKRMMICNIIKSEKKDLLFPTASRCIHKYNLSQEQDGNMNKNIFKMCLPFDPGISLLEVGHKEIIRDRWKDLTTKI